MSNFAGGITTLSPGLSVGMFGPEADTFGSQFRGSSVLNTPRYFDLSYKQSVFDCTNHDAKDVDFDGRAMTRGNGMSAFQPLLTRESFAGYVPLRQRRPSAPYRLGKIVVDAFTSLLFGENRFPAIVVDGDPKTQDLFNVVMKVTGAANKLIEARNYGGAMGTVGLSWCFIDGVPQLNVHNAKNLFVHSWKDRSKLIPRHVSEVYQFPKEEWDTTKSQYVNNLYWYRRDWAPNWDVVFYPVLVEPGKDPKWEPDLRNSVIHNDGVTHIRWVQNRPSEGIDGLSDNDGNYELYDTIDVLHSVVVRGAILNLDPTLKLRMDPEMLGRSSVKKGSNNALVVGLDGDADYLELSGTSIEAGLKLFESLRRSALETARCILPDPHEIAAQGVSSVTIKALYAPMLAAADVLREQYAQGLRGVLTDMQAVIRKASNSKVTIFVPNEEGTEDAVEVPVEIKLPPRVEQVPVVDEETGKPTGDVNYVRLPRELGEGGEIDMKWPPYFQPTPDDQAKISQTLNMATGGKPFLTKQSAVNIGSQYFGIDPTDEWKRMEAQAEQDKADERDLMKQDGVGGQVPDENSLPEGALPRKKKPPVDDTAVDDTEEAGDEEEAG